MDINEIMERFVSAIVLSVFAAVCACLPSFPADNLKLTPGISFDYDGDSVFPITADNMADVEVAPGKRNLIFFGAPGDLNTNRQARRVVEMSKKLSDTKFIVINVDKPINDNAKVLINRYYPGYVPAQLVIDASGNVAWTHVGECSKKRLKSSLENAM